MGADSIHENRKEEGLLMKTMYMLWSMIWRESMVFEDFALA